MRNDPLLRLNLPGRPTTISAVAAGTREVGSGPYRASRRWVLPKFDASVFPRAGAARALGVQFDYLSCAPGLIAQGLTIIDGSRAPVTIDLDNSTRPALRVQLELGRELPSPSLTSIPPPDDALVVPGCDQSTIEAAGLQAHTSIAP